MVFVDFAHGENITDPIKSMNLDKLLDLFRKFNAEYFESQLQIYSVEYKEDFEDGHMGRYDPQGNRILIREGLCDSQERITLLHEMIHKRIESSDYHGADFQAELARCAENSCPSFQEEILSELKLVKDLDRFDYMHRNTWIEMQIELLVTEKPGRPWAEIKQCVFEASRLTDPEFAEIEGWISALWNYYCGLSNHRPPAPAIGKQKGID